MPLSLNAEQGIVQNPRMAEQNIKVNVRVGAYLGCILHTLNVVDTSTPKNCGSVAPAY
ncbi:MAG TPA: hypothetical protein PKW71_01270 [Anaerohalosphaeraceae bacterium]|nr:hypothetical protein [Anaerohalosphaeraceae bacterium]